jgi:hypothetical protein
MVIAVGSVGVVEMAVDQIVHVPAMRHGLVSAVRPVLVTGLMPPAIVGRRTGVGIGSTDGELVLVNVVLVDEMQAAVVEVIDVIVVSDGGVAATVPVGMGVVLVNAMGLGHGPAPLQLPGVGR